MFSGESVFLKMREDPRYDCFIAEVKNENISSRRMFSAEGFKQTGITGGISHFKKIVHNGFDSQTL